MLRDLWRYRHNIADNAINDLRSRHVGVALGRGWVLLPGVGFP
jgi:hypothetical protein